MIGCGRVPSPCGPGWNRVPGKNGRPGRSAMRTCPVSPEPLNRVPSRPPAGSGTERPYLDRLRQDPTSVGIRSGGYLSADSAAFKMLHDLRVAAEGTLWI